MRPETNFDKKRQAGPLVPARRSFERRRPVKVTAKTSTIKLLEKPPSYPGPETLARTKRLLLAALRVWELKRGLRE